MWVCRAWLSGTYLAMHQMKKAPTAVFLLVRGLSVSVGDTWFEPVTYSVSGQNLWLGIRGECGVRAGLLMCAIVRAGWPT
jgi:hypothetical protein